MKRKQSVSDGEDSNGGGAAGFGATMVAAGRCLAYLLPGLLVLAMGALLFEQVAPDPYRIGGLFAGLIRGAGAADTSTVVSESVSRTAWLFTAFLYITLSVLATVVYAVLAWRSTGRRVLMALCAVGAVGVMVAWGGPALGLLYGGEADYTFHSRVVGMLFWLSYQTLGTFYAVQGMDAAMVGIGLPFAVNAIGTVAVASAMIAGCAILDVRTNSSAGSLADLEQRLQRLRYAVNVVSVQMLAGVLQIIAWLRWPVSLVPDELVEPEDGARLILTVSLYWGTVFTLAIAAFYLPAMAVLRARVEETLASEGSTDPQAWLREHGFTRGLRQMVPQAVTVLSPLLVAPVGSFLSGFVGPA